MLIVLNDGGEYKSSELEARVGFAREGGAIKKVMHVKVSFCV